MKILYYSPHPLLILNSQTGYGTHMREMIHAFRTAGHEVTPIIMGGEEEPGSKNPHQNDRKGLKSRSKDLIPRVVWETAKDYRLLQLDRRYEGQLLEEIERHKPDMIYERGSYLQCSGIHAAQKKGIPHVLEMNAPQVLERRIRLNVGTLLEHRARRIERKQLLGTTKVAAVSQALSDHFVENYDVDPGKIVCTPNAIDPLKVNVDADQVRSIREKHSLNNSYVLGFVGSVLKWHRVDLLIEACQKLRDASVDVRVLIVGASKLIPELQRLSKRLGVSDYVVFAGKVSHEEVFNYIAAMDAAVLPDNLWYQSPVKVFEYGAAGKPVIGPDNVTVRNLIRHKEEGLLVKPHVESLVEAIRFFVEHPDEASRMARTLKEKVFSEYTWSRNAERVLDEVFEVLPV